MFNKTAKTVKTAAAFKTAQILNRYTNHVYDKAEKKELNKPSIVAWGQGNYQDLTDALNGDKPLIDILYPENPNTIFKL